LIDFGLSVFEPSIEARGVDIHVFFQCLKGTHEAEGYDKLRDSFIKGYKRRFKGVGADADKVLNRVKQIESRGRYIERKERVIAKCLIQSDV
jgi:tRNA A-37 threonylcarbamoyl transferase component Bud32